MHLHSFRRKRARDARVMLALHKWQRSCTANGTVLVLCPSKLTIKARPLLYPLSTKLGKDQKHLQCCKLCAIIMMITVRATPAKAA